MESATATSLSISDRARSVLKEMTRLNIAPSPENYHVWFKYRDGNNPELSAAIDGILNSEKSLNGEAIRDLYKEHIATDLEAANISRAQHAAQTVLKDILGDLLTVGDFASEYKEKLGAYAVSLDAVRSSDEFKDVITGLLQDTAAMNKASAQLQSSLEEARTRAESLQEQLSRVEEETLRDHLTGLWNRKAAEETLGDLLKLFTEEAEPFCVVTMDIDHFKKFNDAYGHSVGDGVLRLVSTTLQDNVKGRDFPARFGGEEFLVLLPMTKLQGGAIVADQIRKAISAKKLRIAETSTELPSITASFGVAEVSPGDTMKSLIDRVDKALYLAKDSGRNNVKTQANL